MKNNRAMNIKRKNPVIKSYSQGIQKTLHRAHKSDHDCEAFYHLYQIPWRILGL